MAMNCVDIYDFRIHFSWQGKGGGKGKGIGCRGRGCGRCISRGGRGRGSGESVAIATPSKYGYASWAFPYEGVLTPHDRAMQRFHEWSEAMVGLRKFPEVAVVRDRRAAARA